MALADPISNPILAQAQAAVNKYSAAANVALEQQQAITKKATATTEVVTKAVEDTATAVNIINTQSNIADLQAQNSRIAAFEAAGGTEYLKSLMQELGATSKEVLTAQQKVEDIQNQPVNGVIDYFSQQFSLIGPEDKLNAAKQRVANISNSISAITSAQESITRAVNTTKQTVNTATIAAESNKVAAIATGEAAKAQLAGLSTNADMLARMMSSNATQVNAVMKVYDLQNTEENQIARRKDQEFRAEEHAQAIKQWEEGSKLRALQLEKVTLDLADTKNPTRIAALNAQREDILKKHEDALAFEATYIPAVQRAQAAAGQPVEEASTIRVLRLDSTAFKLKYDTLFNRGADPETAFGTTPSDAAVKLNITGAARTEPVKLLDTFKLGFASSPDSKDAAGKPIKAGPNQNAAFDNYVKKVTTSWASNIKEGDATNPYHAPPMAVLTEYPGVKDSILYKKVLALREMKEFNAKRIYDATVAGIAAGDITIEDAAIDISSLFTHAAIHNSESKMFRRIGLPNQTSYNTEIVPHRIISEGDVLAAPLGVGSVLVKGIVGIPSYKLGKVFDLATYGEIPITNSMDPVQVKQALVKLISDKRSAIGGLF